MKHTIFPRCRITGNGNLSRAAMHIPDKKIAIIFGASIGLHYLCSMKQHESGPRVVLLFETD